MVGFSLRRISRWAPQTHIKSSLYAAVTLAYLALSLSGFLPPARLARADASQMQFSQPCGNPGTPAQIHHVVWIWMENEAYSSVIGNSKAPYQTNLAQSCGVATNFHNESHGSLDNYIAATDGQNILGTSFVNDCLPNTTTGACMTSSPSIFSQMDSSGQSWRGYAESMTSNCQRTNATNYAARHNPAVYYLTLNTCGQYDVNMGDSTSQTGAFYDDVRSGNLPNFSFITPNLVNDAHDSSVTVGDNWMSQIIPFLTTGANYQSGDTAIFITTDEGCGGNCGPDYAINEDCTSQALAASQPSCHIPLTVVAPYVPTGKTDGTFYTHYSMLRSAEDLLGVPELGLAASAASLNTSFNLTSSSSPSPPAAPANLTASATSASQVNLSWSAAAPGSASVTSYLVSRNGVVIGTTANTAYTDTTTVAGGSYSYTVTAVDANNLVGLPSSTVTVTTPNGLANLLTNPGFETWSGTAPSGWNTYGTPTFTQTTAAHSGSYAASIVSSSSSWGAAGVSISQKSAIAGQSYTGSCWVKSASAIPDNMLLKEYTTSWGTPAGSPSSATTILKLGDNNWHQVSVSYTVLNTGDMVYFANYVNSVKAGSGSFVLDDCSLTLNNATPADTIPPSAPTNLQATASSQSTVNLSWTAATDDTGVTGYTISRNGTVVGSTTNATTYTDTGLDPGTTYTYSVTAHDAAGNVSNPSSIVSVVTQTPQPPAAPTNVVATAVSPSQVSLNWTAAAAGSTPVASYQIYRGGVLIGSTVSTSYADSGLSASTTYGYTVVAVDTAAATSPASTEADVTTLDMVYPYAPSGLAASANSPAQVGLNWTVPAASSYPIVGYQIFRNGIQVGTSAAASFTDNGLTPSTSYSYSVTAVDSAGNISPASTTADVVTSAPVPPSSPTKLTATASNATTVGLSWSAAVSGSYPVTSYQIFRGGVLMGTSPTTSYTDTTVLATTSYSYTVVAVDSAGQASTPSAPAVVTTPSSAPINILSNPSFETWSGSSPTGWNTFGTPVYTQVSDAHAGTYSTSIASSSTSWNSAGLTYQTKSAVAGVTYTGSCWVKSSKPLVAYFRFKEYSASWGTPAGTSEASTSLTLGDGQWHQLTVVYKGLATGDWLTMSSYVSGVKSTSGAYQVDDCSLSVSSS